MGKKRKNNTKRNVIIGIFIIAILGIGYFGVLNSIIGSNVKIRTYESTEIISPVSGNFTFSGIGGTYDSTFIGSALSNGRAGGYYINSQSDNEISISNSFVDGETLSINSNLVINEYSNSISNENQFAVTLPNGVLTINCDISAKAEASYASKGECGILGNLVEVFSVGKISDRNYQSSESEEIVIEIVGEKEVVFVANSKFTGERSNAGVSTELRASFEETIIIEDEVVETPEEEVPDIPEESKVIVECLSNVECTAICEDRIPTCQEGSCFCSGEEVKKEFTAMFFLIPIAIIGLVALIIWQLRKKPRKR